jgi:hypothetical protein
MKLSFSFAVSSSPQPAAVRPDSKSWWDLAYKGTPFAQDMISRSNLVSAWLIGKDKVLDTAERM